MREPRVALFCETFHEINGVALTIRQLVHYARRQGRAMLAVQSGERFEEFQSGSVRRMELPRGWASFGIESDLRYDPLLWRHLGAVREAVREFKPDVIHVTSPGEFGQLGAWIAHTERLPLVASWHTNLHQFAGKRLSKMLRLLPAGLAKRAQEKTEAAALAALVRFYRIARVTLAPNPEQVEWLGSVTQRPCFFMPRGVDCAQFSAARRSVRDGVLRLGYVGRVTPEKNVRLLRDVEKGLEAAGIRDYSFVIVGQGSEQDWLRRNLQRAEFAGVLRGDLLAEAYANMDVLVFPSRTDTFGNVVQEAGASGVAAVVTDEGGPRHLVVEGVTGAVCANDEEFVRKTVELVNDRARLRRMGDAARKKAEGASWDAAIERVYAAYARAMLPVAQAETRKGKMENRRVAGGAVMG
ncbi:MAG TPA: glycosyltransferase [Dongiaceae bacterium]|nr:glycosyltransferase [Dongiaceae bacterium]